MLGVADYYRAGINWRALLAWLAGVTVGLVFTVSPWFSGPLATGIFATSSLGYLLGFLVSALLYWLLSVFVTRAPIARVIVEDQSDLQTEVTP